MDSLNVHNDKIGEIINKYDIKLDITDFLTEIGYNIDKIYIDKFWDSIESNKWLYIDNNMLAWMGYNCTDIKDNKKTYIKLLHENFNEDIDYKLINNKEFKENSLGTLVSLENNDINMHNKTKHLIVSPRCFKKSLNDVKNR